MLNPIRFSLIQQYNRPKISMVPIRDSFGAPPPSPPFKSCLSLKQALLTSSALHPSLCMRQETTHPAQTYSTRRKRLLLCWCISQSESRVLFGTVSLAIFLHDSGESHYVAPINSFLLQIKDKNTSCVLANQILVLYQAESSAFSSLF